MIVKLFCAVGVSGGLLAASVPGDTAAALAKCGVLRSEVNMEWADALQDDVVKNGPPDRILRAVRLD